MEEKRNIRVLIAKPGLDGHDRGAKIVSQGLKEAGFDVIYTGLRQTPEMITMTALQEDVDIIGLSILSGAHIPLVTEVQKQLKKASLTKPIFVGGIIPEEEAKWLMKKGVSAVFGPHSSIDNIVKKIHNVLE